MILFFNFLKKLSLSLFSSNNIQYRESWLEKISHYKQNIRVNKSINICSQ